MLDVHPDLLLKRHAVLDLVTVGGDAGHLIAFDSTTVISQAERPLVEIPAARIEVLGARAVNGGKRLAIHINLLVALQKPDAPVALHVRMLADVMAASAHLEDMERLSGDRRLPVPLRVEVARIRQRLLERTIGEAPYHLGERRLPGVGK